MIAFARPIPNSVQNPNAGRKVNFSALNPTFVPIRITFLAI